MIWGALGVNLGCLWGISFEFGVIWGHFVVFRGDFGGTRSELGVFGEHLG